MLNAGLLILLLGIGPRDRIPTPQQDYSLVRQTYELYTEINHVRKLYGLTELRMEPRLSRVAQWMAGDLARREMITHRDSLGRNCGGRADAFGYSKFTILRENLLGGLGNPRRVVQEWLASGAHRQNLLANDVTEIGIGYVHNQETQHWHYWVIDLAGPAK